MSQNYSGRLTGIAIVLIVGLFGIPFFTPGIFDIKKVFNSSIPWSERTEFKPGIDINGGTSMVYEIIVPPGTRTDGTLAAKVAASLKLRVDPLGVRNLIWRPEGDTRLEIQIPRSAAADRAGAVRAAFIKAGEALDAGNIHKSEVVSAVKNLSGAARDKRLAELAGDSAARQTLFADLAQTWDRSVSSAAARDEAKARGDIAAENAEAAKNYEAITRYDKDLVPQIDKTNLKSEELRAVLEMPAGDREARIAEIKKQNAGFPQRLAALDGYIKAHADYQGLKGAIDDATELKALLKGSGVLAYHILVTPSHPMPGVVNIMLERMKPGGPGPGKQALDEAQWFLADRPSEFPPGGEDYVATWNGKTYVLASIRPGDSMVHKEADTGDWHLQDVQPSRNPDTGQQVVNFGFDPQGGVDFGTLTGSHVDAANRYRLAIVLDDKIISAPSINARINSSGVIEGDFSQEQIDYLVHTLAAGSSPAQLANAPISEQTISPQLGRDNLFRGLASCGIGLVVVSVFLVGYYYLAGVVATIAVFMNLVIILGILCMFGATFTMPSIAGIVLTVGTAVDANVLIFERLREEQHRGLSLRMALRNAYDRAFSAIVDSNMTTVITSFFLWIFGSEEVKGFGLTLLIGIGSSLFTALFVTRTIFDLLIDRFDVRNLGSLPLTFPKWDKLLRPNIDWMGLIWPFITFSTVFITLGLSAFVKNGRNMYDIEFVSGTSVQFDLKGQGMTHDQVMDLIQKENDKTRTLERPDGKLPSPSVVSLNDSTTAYEFVTPNDHRDEVSNALLDAMGKNLKINLPSKFDLSSEKDVDKLLNGIPAENLAPVVVPVQGQTLVNGVEVPEIDGYTGGALIELRHLDPPLSPKEIKDRIINASVEPGSPQSLANWTWTVVRLDGLNASVNDTRPTDTAGVLVYAENFNYGASVGNWKANVVAPMWKLVDAGVNHEARLQKVSNFNPQVAGDTRDRAFMATFLSIVVIMIYIWIRFGNLKYGTATVVALIHDTLFVVGAVGLSHYLGGTALGRALLVEPFRINLTLVAAILTIMGYSMIDTIVVFDRIRENRGKYGLISRQVINDSINQTLSRTLLTCGTTITTVSVMYIVGGAGVHGFTFVLLVGILVGTYSSIAIAAPILLFHANREVPVAGKPASWKAPIGQAQKTNV